MPSAEGEVTIGRPVAEVFAFVADGLNAPKWRPGVLDISLESGRDIGAVYKQGVKGPGGRRIAADYRVTAFEPNRRLGFEAIAGPVRPTGQFTFEDVNGATRVTFGLQAELSGFKKLLMGGMVQRTMDAEVAALGRLKAVLEAPQAG
jgi:uncharacterized membrane protein